ncbi:hypothetical protein ACNI3K_08830 [Demequina sp. SO4-13]|uniref:hypothetical protein n=1 Tax=Demequina sp. SO4-13 TaxID=3401027 RepID=UPI003AF6411F
MTTVVESLLAGHADISMAAQRLGTNRKMLIRYKARYIAAGRIELNSTFGPSAGVTSSPSA